MVWTELRGPGDLELPSVGPAGAPGVNGVFSNVTLAKVALYTIANADKGKSLDLSGGFYTVTWGAASGYDDDHVTFVYNASPTRFKILSIPGITGIGVTGDYWLPPLHHAIVRKSNGVWTLFRNPRWKTPRATTFDLYCNHATGSDTLNDGMDVSSPFQSWQRGLEFILNEVDPNTTSGPTRFEINMAAGVASDEGIHFSPHSFMGQGGQFVRTIFGAVPAAPS